jgi:WD40 repeat protein
MQPSLCLSVSDSTGDDMLVQLWQVDSRMEGQEFIADLCDHDKAVNVVRFSPCGRYLASASVNCIYIYLGL